MRYIIYEIISNSGISYKIMFSRHNSFAKPIIIYIQKPFQMCCHSQAWDNIKILCHYTKSTHLIYEFKIGQDKHETKYFQGFR